MGVTGSAILGLAVVGIALLGLSIWRNSVLRRISFRNVARRKGSTLLVIIGSVVGTALIAGSLVISDTSRRLNQDVAYRYLGEIDEVVALPGPQGQGNLYFDRERVARLVTVATLNAETEAAQGEALVDGALVVVQEQAPVRKVDPATGESILVEPRVTAAAAVRGADVAGIGADVAVGLNDASAFLFGSGVAVGFAVMMGAAAMVSFRKPALPRWLSWVSVLW